MVLRVQTVGREGQLDSTGVLCTPLLAGDGYPNAMRPSEDSDGLRHDWLSSVLLPQRNSLQIPFTSAQRNHLQLAYQHISVA